MLNKFLFSIQYQTVADSFLTEIVKNKNLVKNTNRNKEMYSIDNMATDHHMYSHIVIVLQSMQTKFYLLWFSFLDMMWFWHVYKNYEETILIICPLLPLFCQIKIKSQGLLYTKIFGKTTDIIPNKNVFSHRHIMIIQCVKFL